MRLRLATLIVCAFALLAAPARADHGATVNDPVLERYMAIAQDYWGAPEPVCTLQDGEVIHPHAILANDPRPDVAAWAEVGGCRMWLDTDFWPAPPSELYCNLIAHEWGHLLGHQHSTDSADLMWPDWTNEVVPGCKVFSAPPRPAAPAPAPTPKVKRYRSSQLDAGRRACASRHRRRRVRAHRACYRKPRRVTWSSRVSQGTIEPFVAPPPPAFNPAVSIGLLG